MFRRNALAFVCFVLPIFAQNPAATVTVDANANRHAINPNVYGVAYASTAQLRGVRVIIAGAGMAAALPGVVAAYSDLPVIGVPLRSSKSVGGGLDALLAIAQMPPGVPVACVGVDNARNAAVLAARIIG